MIGDTIANALIRTLGHGVYLALAYSMMTVVPVVIVAALFHSLRQQRRTGRDGLALGLAVAAWASLCWIVFPYCGAYPNLPWLLLMVPFSPLVDTWGEEFFLHVMNFLAWPLLGWLLLRSKS